MYALYGCLDYLPSNMPLPQLQEVAGALTQNGEYSWDLSDWASKNYRRIISLIHQGGRIRLGRVFNVDSDIFKKSSFDWQLSKDSLLQTITTSPLDFRLEVGKQNDALRILKPAGKSVAQLTLLSDKLPDVGRHISDAIVRFLLDQSETKKVFLIPAERAGLHLFYRELSTRRSALFHHASREEIDINKLLTDILRSRYAEPIADYIDWLNELRTLRRLKSPLFRTRADALRKSLLAGKYEIDNEGVISFTPQKRKRTDAQAPTMPLHMSSSTAKSLFGLWFFLDHLASSGDVLMIDEPELNLHPGAQRKIARILATLANQGLKIVISTHSDYLIRELNSLMMLSRAHPKRDELMKLHNYQENEILNPEDVAAYLFDDGEIIEMNITPEEGIAAKTFDSVIHDLNETSDSIYYEYLSSQE
ncbi:AAA family ATPase [Burkholderia sp. AU4i]|uniref:AAA family ATPase n=1 Tax=Burkholderia sp. AU4i TaxID=1335308 RepID=UPI0009E0667F